jgi:hypothetical protein
MKTVLKSLPIGGKTSHPSLVKSKKTETSAVKDISKKIA